MYTAQITNKEVLANGQVLLTMQFTNGTDTFTEQVTPQDKGGLDFWVIQRLRSLNSVDELKDIDPATAEPISIPVVPEKTQAELEAEEWLRKYHKWVQIKNNLIDTSVLTGSEPQVVAFLADVKAGFKPAYLNLL